MDVTLADSSYSYTCDAGGGSSLSTVSDNGGMGPSFSTSDTPLNFPECPWPTSAPTLWLDVMFRNFLLSEGIPPGTWDLAAPESILPLRVEFGTSVAGEQPIGQEAPYQYYDSTAPIEGAEGPIPYVTYQGYYQSPISTGSLTVTRLPTVEHTGYSTEAEFLGIDAGLYLVELSNVTLGATDFALPNPDDPFPPTVLISSAALTYAL